MILLIEDEPNFGALLQDYLQMNDFDVRLCRDGLEGLAAFREGKYQLCILDVMMPKMDGFTLAREIRKLDEQVPMIFLTAKNLPEDKVKGFRLGADDYITKPFHSEELLFRIRAILRRSGEAAAADPSTDQFDLKAFRFDARLRTLSQGDREEKLSPKESELLRLLCLHQNDLLPREKALHTIWEDDNYFNARSMDVFITRLRKRFRNHPGIQIENVHGKGFRLLIR
jgi:DNA-binding response OmpR family regulator